MNKPHVTFAPMLYLKDVKMGIDYYMRAFDAVELRRFSNKDGTVHVAEMAIGGSLLRLHEEVKREKELSPNTLRGTTTIIGMLVDDPDATMAKAAAVGGTVIHPVKDHEYGFRQGTIVDPFGHRWEIEKASLVKQTFTDLTM